LLCCLVVVVGQPARLIDHISAVVVAAVVRHLGRVRRLMLESAGRTSEHDQLLTASHQHGITHLILVELIARALKTSLHSKMRHLRTLSDDHYRSLVVSFFNIVFCQTSPEITSRYWMALKDQVNTKYPQCLTEVCRSTPQPTLSPLNERCFVSR
jgi:hypothetical protein